MPDIELNGAPHRLAGATLLDLAESLGVADQMVALAVNRNVVPRSRWHACTLEDRDKVELVRAIGGG
ncbi:sulfur carrier protein ThiS [Massilia solisilvae]|uniref:Sulfur carrier protein ThiS n=1 Tax=Massilia solisilvae TaxID=1811225 RepID=A0ABT2BQ98_9BURK|nr:sulfur carrier protein ThiS [Massilia solisilvae]MCS0610688.1 sulfur carrier protein ThiS [Massilia solisilvae]